MPPWVTSDAAWTSAGIFAGLSIGLTSHHIYKHLKHYNCPPQQKWIVRILFMVPVYALGSWLSLRFFHLAIYFDTMRNIYEAYVIYDFLSLCFEYLGGEAAIMTAIKGRAHRPSWWTFTCCFSEFSYTPTFLRICKQGTLQFCYVKPVMALIIIILYATDSFNDGDLRPDRGYLYVTIIYNISIGTALWALMLFYTATRDLLSPHHPVLKFLVVKSVIFLSFWQSVLFAIMARLEIITTAEDGTANAAEVAVAYQNFLICFEMFFAAVLHLYAFPWRPYAAETRGRSVSMVVLSRNLKSTLNPSDMIDDTIRNFSKSYSHYHQIKGEPEVVEEEGEGAVANTSFRESTRTRPPKGVERSGLLEADETQV